MAAKHKPRKVESPRASGERILAWQSAQTAVPEPLVDVLIVLDDGSGPHVDLGYRTSAGTWFYTGGDAISAAPSHWRPVPRLPNAEGPMRPILEETMQPRLQALLDATNQAIETARTQVRDFDEAINWGDLRCVTAEYSVDQDGCGTFKTMIEEAAPDCPVFHDFIQERLMAAGFPDVLVTTEW